jgi:hypothetical protein
MARAAKMRILRSILDTPFPERALLEELATGALESR